MKTDAEMVERPKKELLTAVFPAKRFRVVL